jgi:hypothetical protein
MNLYKMMIMKKMNLDKNELGRLENIDFQPVFILGLHRSGTSILYKMLTETGCFNSVTAYHIIRYNELLYNNINNLEKKAKDELTQFLKKHQKDRGIDKLNLDADFAEEYGFLLREYSNKLKITKQNQKIFTQLAKKIQFISNNNKPLLLKNPYDFTNFILLKKIFPKAKFIFIHRNPYKTLSSTIKAVRYLFNDFSPYTAELTSFYKKIYQIKPLLYCVRLLLNKLSIFAIMLLTYISSKDMNYYLQNIDKILKKDYVSIRYEDLCENPQKNIELIINSFDFSSDLKKDFSKYIRPRITTLDSSVVKMQKFIYKSMKRYFIYFNYNKKVASNQT